MIDQVIELMGNRMLELRELTPSHQAVEGNINDVRNKFDQTVALSKSVFGLSEDLDLSNSQTSIESLLHRTKGHDIDSLNNIARAYLDGLADMPDVNFSFGFRSIKLYQNMWLALSSLCSTNPDFSFPITSEEFEYGVNKNVRHYEVPDDFSPTIGMLYAAVQLRKNAGNDASVYGEVIDGTHIVSVHDAKKGFLNIEGEPLPIEQFSKLFGDYSTTGGGLGLQLVNTFVQKAGGCLEIKTNSEGENVARHYRSSETVKLTSQLADLKTPTGSTTTLYF